MRAFPRKCLGWGHLLQLQPGAGAPLPGIPGLGRGEGAAPVAVVVWGREEEERGGRRGAWVLVMGVIAAPQGAAGFSLQALLGAMVSSLLSLPGDLVFLKWLVCFR